MSLLLSKIEGISEVYGDGWQGRCPACAEMDKDTAGDNLRIWPDSTGLPGPYSCAANQGDAGHSKRIFALAGTGGRVARPRIPSSEEIKLKAQEKAIAKAVQDGAMAREEARQFQWDWQAESGPLPSGRTENWRTFLSLWKPSERIWVGAVKESDKHWGTAPELLEAFPDLPPSGADLTRALVWPEWATVRKMALQPRLKWLVVEADHGTKEEQLRIAGFVREKLGLTLRAVVDSTGKSLHCWFDAPTIRPMSIQILSSFLVGLGADGQAVTAGATRLPGGIRQPVLTRPDKPWGQAQTIVWLNPTSTL